MCKQDSIEVSIVCVTYNHEKYIRKAIEGFLMQKTKFTYEIIIHDDMSTDGTRKILLEYQERYPEKIKLLLEDDNQFSKGIRVLLALCLPEAKGKYIAISDGDDEWTYDRKLQEQYDFMQQNEDVSLCIHNAVCFNTQTGEKTTQIRNMKSRMLTDKEVIMGVEGAIPTTSFFLRTKYVAGIPEYCYRAPVGDDPLRTYYACKGNIFYMDVNWAVRNYMHKDSWNYKMQDLNFKLEYIKKYLIYLTQFNLYSKKRFDIYVQKRIFDMCDWTVYLLTPKVIKQDELIDIIEKSRQKLGNQYKVILENIYNRKRAHCIDYLDIKVIEFIENCYNVKGKLYLYGVGKEAEKFAKRLEYLKILFEGFIVSDGHKEKDIFMGYKIFVALDVKREKSFVWLTLNDENISQVLPYIEKLGYKNILYSRYDKLKDKMEYQAIYWNGGTTD